MPVSLPKRFLSNSSPLNSNISEQLVDKKHYKWNFPLAFGVQPKRQIRRHDNHLLSQNNNLILLKCLFDMFIFIPFVTDLE